MKKLSASLLIGLLLALATLAAQAQTIRRVNNTGVTGTNIYATLQAAHDAATAGDIIQVEPSTTVYGSLSCTKQLTVVGPGYFLAENQPPALQASTIPATVSNIDFQSGSAGTMVSGLVSNGTFYVRVNNISITRCNIAGYIYLSYTTATSNAIVRQNYCAGVQEYSTVSTNSLITNNIFINGNVTLNSTGSSGDFSNNTIINTNVTLNVFTVRNNYFNNSFTPSANTNWDYNLFTNSSLPTAGTVGTHNTGGVALAAVFVLGPGSTAFDSWYKLKSGTNPAVGAGQGGIDVGAYGSATGYAYKPSGLPAIPAIYQLSQTVTGNTLNVNVSTRSNN